MVHCTALPEISREMYNARILCGTNCLALSRSDKPVTEIS